MMRKKNEPQLKQQHFETQLKMLNVIIYDAFIKLKDRGDREEDVGSILLSPL